MKQTLIYILAICILMPLHNAAQNVIYKESLKKNIALFESAKTTNDFVNAANSFEKLASREKKEWLVFYYAGLCNVLAAFEKQHKDIDVYCDKAEWHAKKADSLKKNNSEIAVLKSMIAAARINVNKTERGQKYGTMASRLAAEAIKLDETNPRAYFVKGMAILNTPPIFGGGKKKAKPVFELVVEKSKGYKPESVLHPQWGRDEAEKELQKINSSGQN